MKTRLPVRAALIGSLSLLLAACAASPQPAHAPVQISMRTVRSANYGVYPKNYERQIRQYLNETLLDGDSARIRIITPPRKVFSIYKDPADNYTGPGQLKYAQYYVVCVNVNAKNAFGGYTGWQTQRYQFVNGRMADEQKIEARVGHGTDFTACNSKDEIFIDTWTLLDKVKVNIVP